MRCCVSSKLRLFPSCFLVLLSLNALALDEGKITNIGFSGGKSAWGQSHSDLVQIVIEGGYAVEGCHSSYAAIKKSDTHLISAALAAYTSGLIVRVYLDASERYHDGSRCYISDLFLVR